nr:MAG TPA: hypothetical protein [Caudoviricetes sp.]
MCQNLSKIIKISFILSTLCICESIYSLKIVD